VRGLLSAAKAPFVGSAPDTQVEVIVVRVAACWLVKNPGCPNHRLRRTLVAGRVPQETRLEVIGAEQPFHARPIVHDQGTYEVPVPRFVEAENAFAHGRQPETVET
jgi:hypothetical protein